MSCALRVMISVVCQTYLRTTAYGYLSLFPISCLSAYFGGGRGVAWLARNRHGIAREEFKSVFYQDTGGGDLSELICDSSNCFCSGYSVSSGGDGLQHRCAITRLFIYLEEICFFVVSTRSRLVWCCVAPLSFYSVCG